MKFRSALTLTVALALVSSALAVPPGEQAGQHSMMGTIVQINPKGNLITVEPLSGAQLQTQQAVVKPGKKTGPITVLVDQQTVILGGPGKGKPMPGPFGKQKPPIGKQTPMPSQAKILSEEGFEGTAAPAGPEMVELSEMVAPAEAIAPEGQPALLQEGPAPAGPAAGPSQGFAPPTEQGQATVKPQQKPQGGKVGPKPQTQQTGKPQGKQKPGKPMGKIGPKLNQLQVGQLVQMTVVGIVGPVGPGQTSPVQGKPQPVQSQSPPAQSPPGKVKPGQGQAVPSQTVPSQGKLVGGGADRGVAVELVEPTPSPGPSPAISPVPGGAKFRAVSIQILKTMDRPMPAPGFRPPAEPQPPAPPEPQPPAPATPAGPSGEF